MATSTTKLSLVKPEITDETVIRTIYNTNLDSIDTNNPKHKFDATTAPTVNNDTDEGYNVGSNWYDVTNDKAYLCLDNTDGAAVWKVTAPAGSGGSVGTSGTPVDNDFAKFTDANTIEGRSYEQIRNDLQNHVKYPQDYATGTGTSGDPWAGNCIEDAYDAASAGDTVYLRAGYYELSGTLTIAKRISIIGEGIQNTIVMQDDATGIHINETDYVVLKGFTIDGSAVTPQAPRPCIYVDACNYALIEDMEVLKGGTSGIDPTDSSYCYFHNIWAHHNGEDGIHPGADTDGRNIGNTYQNIHAWSNTDTGMDIGSGNYLGEDNLYDNIVCWDNTHSGVAFTCEKGSILSNACCHDNGTDGIYMEYVEESHVVDCIISNNGRYGIKHGVGNDVNFTNIKIKNNDDGGVYLLEVDNTVFTSCQIFDDQTPKVQPYGIITVSTTDDVRLIGCDLSGNLTGNINNGASATITSVKGVVDGDEPSIGDIQYHNGTNWVILAKGTSGQVLTMGGSNIPEWATP